jgi:hypothetical protein
MREVDRPFHIITGSVAISDPNPAPIDLLQNRSAAT